MKITIHTKYGVFNTDELEYDEKTYKGLETFLESIHKLEYIAFQVSVGEIYMTKEMIDRSLFILQK